MTYGVTVDLPVELDERVGGWWLVQWKNGARTYLRDRLSAVILADALQAVAPRWTKTLGG